MAKKIEDILKLSCIEYLEKYQIVFQSYPKLLSIKIPYEYEIQIYDTNIIFDSLGISVFTFLKKDLSVSFEEGLSICNTINKCLFSSTLIFDSGGFYLKSNILFSEDLIIDDIFWEETFSSKIKLTNIIESIIFKDLPVSPFAKYVEQIYSTSEFFYCVLDLFKKYGTLDREIKKVQSKKRISYKVKIQNFSEEELQRELNELLENPKKNSYKLKILGKKLQ